MFKYILLFILLFSSIIYANDKNIVLMEAIRDGDLKEITYLIKNGADVNFQDKDNKTPLNLAYVFFYTFAKHGANGDSDIYNDIIKLLKESGAK